MNKEQLTASLERRYGGRKAAAGKRGPGGGRHGHGGGRGDSSKPKDIKKTIKYIMSNVSGIIYAQTYN